MFGYIIAEHLFCVKRMRGAVGIEYMVEVEAVHQARETLGTEDIPGLGLVRQVRAIAQQEEVMVLD